MKMNFNAGVKFFEQCSKSFFACVSFSSTCFHTRPWCENDIFVTERPTTE